MLYKKIGRGNPLNVDLDANIFMSHNVLRDKICSGGGSRAGEGAVRGAEGLHTKVSHFLPFPMFNIAPNETLPGGCFVKVKIIPLPYFL